MAAAQPHYWFGIARNVSFPGVVMDVSAIGRIKNWEELGTLPFEELGTLPLNRRSQMIKDYFVK